MILSGNILHLYVLFYINLRKRDKVMFYVYILKSVGVDWRYVGYSSDLKERFRQHNNGKVKATRNYRPFELACYIAVMDKETALKLERYFKSGSGIAWMNRHLLAER